MQFLFSMTLLPICFGVFAQGELQRLNISDFGAIKHKLADMAVKTFAIESATYRIGHLIDLKYQSMLASGVSPYESKLSAIREYAIECSISKVYGSDILCYVADESIQISELTDHVIKISKSKGFEEKQTHIITKESDWTFLSSENENLDLFGSKKIIIIPTKAVNISISEKSNLFSDSWRTEIPPSYWCLDL